VKEEVNEVDEVRKELNDLKSKQEVKELKERLTSNLELAVKNNEFAQTEEGKEEIEDAKEVAIARYYMNPQKTISAYFNEAMEKKQQKHAKRQEYLKKKYGDIERSGEAEGGSGAFSLEKPFTRQDLKTPGKLRKAAEAMMKAAGKVG
jgi:hypothetical protein